MHWTSHLPLAVAVIIYVDASSASQENGRSSRDGKLDGFGSQEQGLGGVDGWNPVQAAPAEVVACPVMCYVHGVPVASLPSVQAFVKSCMSTSWHSHA